MGDTRNIVKITVKILQNTSIYIQIFTELCNKLNFKDIHIETHINISTQRHKNVILKIHPMHTHTVFIDAENLQCTPPTLG